jgi:hypothetical protein
LCLSGDYSAFERAASGREERFGGDVVHIEPGWV